MLNWDVGRCLKLNVYLHSNSGHLVFSSARLLAHRQKSIIKLTSTHLPTHQAINTLFCKNPRLIIIIPNGNTRPYTPPHSSTLLSTMYKPLLLLFFLLPSSLPFLLLPLAPLPAQHSFSTSSFTSSPPSSPTALNTWFFGGTPRSDDDRDQCELVAVKIERTSANSRRIGEGNDAFVGIEFR